MGKVKTLPTSYIKTHGNTADEFHILPIVIYSFCPALFSLTAQNMHMHMDMYPVLIGRDFGVLSTRS